MSGEAGEHGGWRARPGVAQAALLIAIVTVAARTFGFVRVVVFARTVGPSCLGDTYFTANTIPNIVFDIVAGGALSSLVVPVLAHPVAAGDRATVDRTASALLTWVVSILVPAMVVGALLTEPLMRLLVGGGHPGCPAADEVHVGARMLLVFVPQIVLYGIGIVLTGIVQAHRRFLGPALGPLMSSIVVIAAYLVYNTVAGPGEADLSSLPLSHELLLSVGTTLGVVALVLPVVWPTIRTGTRFRPTYRFPPGVAATVRRMAISGALLFGSQDLAIAVVLRLINVGGTSGAVVLFNLAWTVFIVPWAVLAVPLATSAFPTLTAAWQGGERERYGAMTARTLRTLLVVAAAAAAVMCAAAGPAARVLVLGAPGAVPPEQLARALVTFAPGLIGYALVALLSRALYAQGNARTPAAATVVGWLIAIGGDAAFVAVLPRSWAVAAVGIGTSIGMTVAGGWLLLVIRRSAGAGTVAGAGRAGAAALAGAAAAIAGGVALARALPHGGPAHSVAIAAIVGTVALAIHVLVVAGLDRGTVRLLTDRVRGLRRA